MKARIVYIAEETNQGKINKLDVLHQAYLSYVQSCINLMVQAQEPSLVPSARRGFFPTSDILSSQIVKNAQAHAVSIVEVWARSLYARKLRKLTNSPEFSDQQKMELRCCGKYGVKKAGKFGKGTISQEIVDLYWGWVWNKEISGSTPQVSENLPLWLSEMTCTFGPSEDSTKFCWWILVSTLERGKRLQVPLSFNPYIKEASRLAKSVMMKKRNGVWTFQFSEKPLPNEIFDGSQGKVGVDVGLNVIAATSDGRTYGKEFKPKFDKLYKKLQSIRANRQRQGLKTNSKRLSRVESKLTGMVKSVVGEISNKLIKAFPKHTFVVEDLNLSGCKGQKRFAYRALHNSLSSKAQVIEVNPAYSSQTCPDCGFVSRNNRSGIKFHCRVCGSKRHADVVGGINLLRRSEDKQINSIDYHVGVKTILRERYLRKRNSSLGRKKEPEPSGPKLNTKRNLGTASN
jgi:transposase